MVQAPAHRLGVILVLLIVVGFAVPLSTVVRDHGLFCLAPEELTRRDTQH